MRNQYKRLDVFRCKLDFHEAFDGKVSVYHVLKVKRCLHEGCFYFKWHCRLLEKGARCRSCPQGRLVDVVVEAGDNGRGFRRELFCLEGMQNPDLCCYSAFQKLRIRQA